MKKISIIVIILLALSTNVGAWPYYIFDPEVEFSEDGRNHLIFSSTFEDGWDAIIKQGYWSGCTEGATEWYTSAMQGDYSGTTEVADAMKFEWKLLYCDQGINWSKKAMLNCFKDHTSVIERWYGFTMYLPSSGMQSDDEGEIIVQWHATPDDEEIFRTPPLAMFNKDNIIRLEWIYDTDEITDPNKQLYDLWDRTIVYLGTAPKDVRLRFVFHIKWDPWGDGFIEVWCNGQQIYTTYNISIGFNDLYGTNLGIGIYKQCESDWLKRIIYFDDIRIGNDQAEYSDVMP